MNILFVIERHGHMSYCLAPEEDQVTLPHSCPINPTTQKIILLVSIPRNDIASHAIAKLHETTAIYAFPACSSPEIGSTKKGAGIIGYRCDQHTWIQNLSPA